MGAVRRRKVKAHVLRMEGCSTPDHPMHRRGLQGLKGLQGIKGHKGLKGLKGHKGKGLKENMGL